MELASLHDDIFLNGYVIVSIWVVSWPTQGLVTDAVKNILDYVFVYPNIADTLMSSRRGLIYQADYANFPCLCLTVTKDKI